LLLGAVASAQTINITEYAVPTANSGPGGIAVGPDGTLWFTEGSANKIGRITTAGVITEYLLPAAVGGPGGITAGPDGALWFTEYYANKIGRITTGGVITEYALPATGGGPRGITAGPDGALWFTEDDYSQYPSFVNNGIGRITTAGAVTEYPVTADYDLADITPGPDGALWFAEADGIGRITTAGVVTEYFLPAASSYPAGITVGPDGALWFAEGGYSPIPEYYASQIGRITTAGLITEYHALTPNSFLSGITVGPDGALWFTERGGNNIGRITTAGTVTEYPVPTANSGPGEITLGPDGALWFTEGNGNNIGRVSIGPTLTITSLNPSTAAAGGPTFTLTVNGTNFSSGATVQWNATPLATTFITSTQLTATVPSSLITSAGTAEVTVIANGITSPAAPFTVNPPGQSCTFTVSPLSAVFAASGGSSSITVTASRTDCTWTATASQPFITFSSNPTLTGSGTIDYNVGPNTTASRSGYITAGTAIFNITQGGTTCTYSLPSAQAGFTAAGGSGAAAILAPPGCNWSAASGVPWVAINPPGIGSGDGSVSYTVAANPSTTPRTGTLTIAKLPYTVAQAGSTNTASCTATVPAAPQVALEGRTEVLGDYLLSCSGLTGPLIQDISLALNTDVTNTPTGGLTDAVLTVNGIVQLNGLVAGYNSLRWPGVAIVPAADGTASVRISHVRADASVLTLATSGRLVPSPITGQATVSGVPVNGALQTMANAAQSLIFTKGQANPQTGGAQTSIPLLFQEGSAAAFTANSTRLRMVLSNLPASVQVCAPVYPVEGATHAQLFSADANGAGGSPVSGSACAGGTYQQLTITSGTATATWVVLAADPTKIETFTFPLLVLNALTADLNTIQVSGSLAPVSDVSVPSATAPVPRYRDFSVPQKLTNLRVTTILSQATPAPSFMSVAAKAPLTGYTSAGVGSNLTFTSQVINDTSDPTQVATNVIIRDNLPTGLTLVSCTATGGAGCGAGPGNQVVENYGTLGAGQSATVTVVAQVGPSLAAGTVVENPVSASSDEVNLDLFASTSSVSFIVLPGPPVVVAGSPASGSGSSQSFTFQFSDPSGYQSLGVVNLLFNSFLDGRNACYLAYVVASNTLVLVDDAGDAGGPFAGSVVLGSVSTIQNSQCAVSLTSSLGSGTTLTLVLNIAFKTGFGGDRVTFVAARDQGAGSSNWQPLGVWQVPFAASQINVTATPARGAAPSGASQQMTFTFTDTKGTGDFGIGNVLINKFIDGRQACYLAYVAASNTLVLIDDAGDAGGPYAGSMVLNGGSGAIQNSQCMVSGAGSAVAFAPNTINVTLNITFQASFRGNRVLYAGGRDSTGGNNTDWQSVGTVTVQ